jgi:hypothetical protein
MNLNQLNIEIYNLEPQEEIKLILHKHWFFLFWIFIKFFGFLFFILIINLINFYFFLVSQVIINIFTIIYTLFCLLFLYILIIEYLLNNIVITNKKLIFLKKINFLKYEIINHKFLVIEEIWWKMKWIFANILNFWTICIKLNEQKIQINFNYITDVFNKVNLILNIIKENKI